MNGGASRDRTDDLVIANDALYQLSYSPIPFNRQTPEVSNGDVWKVEHFYWDRKVPE